MVAYLAPVRFGGPLSAHYCWLLAYDYLKEGLILLPIGITRESLW
jgi:hypothetical protein